MLRQYLQFFRTDDPEQRWRLSRPCLWSLGEFQAATIDVSVYVKHRVGPHSSEALRRASSFILELMPNYGPCAAREFDWLYEPEHFADWFQLFAHEFEDPNTPGEIPKPEQYNGGSILRFVNEVYESPFNRRSSPEVPFTPLHRANWLSVLNGLGLPARQLMGELSMQEISAMLDRICELRRPEEELNQAAGDRIVEENPQIRKASQAFVDQLWKL